MAKSKSANEKRAAKYLSDIKKAVKKFGGYTFLDKGAREVMSLPIDELKCLSLDDLSATLNGVANEVDKNTANRDYADCFLRDVIVKLQDWDKFDELAEKHPWLMGYY